MWLPKLQLHGASYFIHYFNLKIRLSDETGKLTLAKLDGPISKSKLDEKDGRKRCYPASHIHLLLYSSLVFIVDTGKQVFVWIGKETSADENKNAMAYAHVSDLFSYLYTNVDIL